MQLSGKWSDFEKAEVPTIKSIEMQKVIQRGNEFKITVEAENSDSILYFLINSKGSMALSENLKVIGNSVTISIPVEITNELGVGANNIKIFAISNSVLKPDFYESSFIVTNDKTELPTSLSDNIEFTEDKQEYWFALRLQHEHQFHRWPLFLQFEIW